jgi:hypothetical protein
MYDIRSRFIVCIFVSILTLVMLTICLPCKAFASSPSFIRQEVKDNDDDWIYYDVYGASKKAKLYTEEYIRNLTGSSIGNIHSVSYMSDGKTLNATFWLTSPFVGRAIQNLNHSIQYSIYIDADSNRLTGWNGGIDYIETLGWNNSSGTWQSILEEKKSDTFEGYRVLRERNYTHFDKDPYYISMSVDLSALNYPNQYRVVFLAEDFLTKKTDRTNIIKVSDYVNTVHIPTPKLRLSTSPSTVSLSHGEHLSIELRLNSNNSITNIEGVSPTIHFYTNQTGGLVFTFNPDRSNMSSYGFAVSELNIYSPFEVDSRPYTVPIFADISYPSELFLPIKSAVTNSSLLFANPNAHTIETLYLPITVKNLSQQFRDWVTDWLNPVSGAITTVFSLGALFIGLRWGRHSQGK